RDGKSTGRAVTSALLELAARGDIAFDEEKSGLLGLGAKKLGVATKVATPADPVAVAHRDAMRRRGLDDATTDMRLRLVTLASDGFVKPDDMPKLAQYVAGFNERIEKHVVDQG